MLSGDSKRIFRNFLSLSTLEGINYILPLITLPYLVRVLGPTKFGVVAFAQAFITYFVILADYGFYLYTPRIIAIERDNKDRVSKIFSTIMSIKLIFIIFCVGIVFLLVNLIGKLRPESTIFMYTCSMLLGDFLFPTWFFQGMERMQFITILYFIAKLFFLISIFTIIKSQADYIYVPLLNSAGLWLAGAISLFVIKQKFRISFRIPLRRDILYHLRESWYFFLSTLSTSLYTNSGIVILGIITNSTFVGYYSAAEKLIRAVQRILWAASQSLYPHINRLAQISQEQTLRFIRKVLFSLGGIFMVISCVVFIFAPQIANLVLGRQFVSSMRILRILAIIPFLATVSNVLGLQTMFSFGLKDKYARVLIAAAIVSVVCAVILSFYFNYIGTAITVIITELFIITSSILVLRHNKINIFR